MERGSANVPIGDTNDTKSSASDIPTIPMRLRLVSAIGCGGNRRIQMRKVMRKVRFAAALVLIGTVWVFAAAANQRVATSGPPQIAQSEFALVGAH